MNVKELIEVLSKLDQTKEVCIYNGMWDEYYSVIGVTADEDRVVMFG